MNCIRRFRSLALAATFVALAGAPEGAEAQSVNLGSSMSAACLTASCGSVRFALELAGDAYVDLVRIFSSNASVWQFAGLLGSFDRFGNPLGWTATLGNGNLLLRSAGHFGAEPIFLDVAMSTSGTAAQLHTGILTYSGQANTLQSGLGTDISYGGIVTPEPASLLLLGTGLAGVVGAARRRRQSKKV